MHRAIKGKPSRRGHRLIALSKRVDAGEIVVIG